MYDNDNFLPKFLSLGQKHYRHDQVILIRVWINQTNLSNTQQRL